MASSQPNLEQAQTHCLALARGHYENFPTASFLLRREVRPAIAAIYAFARTADDYADEVEFEGRRMELLDAWEQQLDRALSGNPEGPVFIALAAAVERHDLPVQALRDLLDAFRQDVRVSRHASHEELLSYCRRSANPVGRLVLAAHGHSDEAFLRASDAICTGLQLANFWQDVAVDIDKDRIYLPSEEMSSFGVSEEDLRMGRATEAFKRLMAFQLERTRKTFAEGWPLVSAMRGRLGVWLRAVWGGGHRILTLIEAADYDVYRRRPKLRFHDLLLIIPPALVGFTLPRNRPADTNSNRG